jgi:nucleoid-associated protein YgaU
MGDGPIRERKPSMRKDVRIGAIIGGVLMAVLVVYAIIASTTHKPTKAVVIDGGKSSPSGANSGGAYVAPTPDTTAPPRDDRSDAGATPTRDTSTDTSSPAPGGVAVTPIPGASPATPTVGDRASATPPSDPAAGRGPANWAALLSADHLEAEFQPVKTSTPDPALAPVDSATPSVDVPPTQVADATAPGSGSTSGQGSGSSDPAPGSGAKTTPPAVAAQTHKIQAGETFSSIARAVYGDAKYYKEIVKANPSVDPGHLRLGMLITLPDSSQFKHDSKPAEKDASTAAARHSAAPGTQPAVNPKTEYRVLSTDSLYKISQKLYGSPNKVDAIYQLNKGAIGSDPAKLKLNMVLKLPEPPAETASSR